MIEGYAQYVLILELALIVFCSACMALPMLQVVSQWRAGGRLGPLRVACALLCVGVLSISLWALLVNMDAAFNDSKTFGDMPQRAYYAVLFWLPLGVGMPLFLLAYRGALYYFAHNYSEGASNDTS